MNFAKVLLITLLFCCSGLALFGQCDENFTFKTSVSAENEGKIEIRLEGSESSYTFKTYQLDSKGIKLVNTTTVRDRRKEVVIENLRPAYYLVQVEFGVSCKQTIGGLEGILVKSNKDE